MSFFGGAFFGGGFFGGGQTEDQPRSTGGAPHGFYEREFRDSFRVKPEIEKVRKVVQFVAERQVQRLETDSHKQFEELARELELEGIRFETRHLEALAETRDLLINQEIGRLIREQVRLRDEEAMLLILIGAYLT